MKKKGVFICIEGLDGSGKTTQTKLLIKRLRKMGHDVVSTAEPSHGKIGMLIRRYCLHSKKRGSAIVEALLFAADRLEHVKYEILPALNARKIVVSDRYIYSSLAYQGATGLGLEWIKMVNEHAIRPDLAIFIDVKPETVIKRLKPRKSVMENLETQQKVREIYVGFVEDEGLIRVNGDKSIEEVADAVLKIVSGFLRKINSR